MAARTPRRLVELPSRERFRRALERVGCEDEARDEAAVHSSRAHMTTIADATVFPAEHAALLTALRARYRIAVVSNFDDTATAYEILIRHGILAQVDTVVVSEAVGLAQAASGARARRSGCARPCAHEALFVGDTFAEDVARHTRPAWTWPGSTCAREGRRRRAGPPSLRFGALPELSAIL
jgi:FMN phosphatase YigB (HAD superfamily)